MSSLIDMKIPFHKVPSSSQEIKAVSDVIESGWWTTGTQCVKFENNFREIVGATYALSVNSCTSALHLALKAVGVSEGDEVIIPTNKIT